MPGMTTMQKAVADFSRMYLNIIQENTLHQHPLPLHIHADNASNVLVESPPESGLTVAYFQWDSRAYYGGVVMGYNQRKIAVWHPTIEQGVYPKIAAHAGEIYFYQRPSRSSPGVHPFKRTDSFYSNDLLGALQDMFNNMVVQPFFHKLFRGFWTFSPLVQQALDNVFPDSDSEEEDDVAAPEAPPSEDEEEEEEDRIKSEPNSPPSGSSDNFEPRSADDDSDNHNKSEPDNESDSDTEVEFDTQLFPVAVLPYPKDAESDYDGAVVCGRGYMSPPKAKAALSGDRTEISSPSDETDRKRNTPKLTRESAVAHLLAGQSPSSEDEADRA